MKSNVEIKENVQGNYRELGDYMKLGRQLQSRAVFEIFASILRQIKYPFSKILQNTDHGSKGVADFR